MARGQPAKRCSRRLPVALDDEHRVSIAMLGGHSIADQPDRIALEREAVELVLLRQSNRRDARERVGLEQDDCDVVRAVSKLPNSGCVTLLLARLSGTR